MRTPRRLGYGFVAFLAVASLAGWTGVASAGTRTQTYSPPFKRGAQGGDSFNLVYSDPSSGRVMVARGYPFFNPFSCGGSRGGWVTLRVPVRARARISSVEVDFTDALVDSYSFVTASVRRGGRYLGSREREGPIGGSGRIVVPLDQGTAPKGSRVRMDFGVATPSACPNFEIAEARFTRVVVRYA